MAEQTKNQLTTRAQQVKNEAAAGANTANRVGGLLEDMVENTVHNENYPFSEQEDHIRALKDVRIAPFNDEDRYITDSESAETNIQQFAIDNTGTEMYLTSLFVPIGGTVISFNINNTMGSRSNPITSDSFTFSFTDAIQECRVIVYSQRNSKPAILNSSVVIEKGDAYNTSGSINRIVFEFIDEECIIATNTVVDESTIETAPEYIGNGTQTGYNNTTFVHTLDYSNALEGDMMIASFSRADGSDNPVTPPSGWDVLVNVTNMMTVFARKRMSGDPNTYSFTNQNAHQSRGVVMPILRGVNYTNGNTSTLTIGTPLSVANTSPRQIPSVTTTKLATVLAFAVGGSGNNTYQITWQSGWTVRQTRLEFFNTQRLSSVASAQLTGASGTVEYSLNLTQNSSGVLIAFYTP